MRDVCLGQEFHVRGGARMGETVNGREATVLGKGETTVLMRPPFSLFISSSAMGMVWEKNLISCCL